MTSRCSLLIPCFNAEPFLDSLWKSIQRQAVPFSEVIFYDDGSTDDTVAMLKRLGAEVIKGAKNEGPSYARNQLAEAASCEWLHFHDVDDEMDDQLYRAAQPMLNEEVDALACSVDWIDSVTRRVMIPRRYDPKALAADPVAATIENPIGGINGFCRRDRFFEIGGFNETIHCWEDADLYVRLAAAGARFGVLSEVLKRALRRSDGVSRDLLYCWEVRRRLLLEYAQNLGEKYHLLIAAQMEICAAEFIRMGKLITARNVLQDCIALGGHPPTTENAALKLMRSCLPPIVPFGAQFLLRTVSGQLRNRKLVEI